MRISRDVSWFVVVGAVNTGNYYALYLLLHAVGLQYLIAHLAATAVAMIGSYGLNCWLTFRVRPSWRTFLLFPLSSLANLVITTIGLRLLVEQLSVDERIAPVIAGVVAIPVTFVVAKFILAGHIPAAFVDDADHK